ncbi:MAG: 23S rRNA (uracil-C(5))-methyltransferase RlmCD [candidate division BRC1 bacterium ADurb.BinA364]|nr:MAG: 23S rRNA (uracil-C(5))-methyltransferase RlmCD [candidate division BRC1 bacterium ADurb.BinA364]
MSSPPLQKNQKIELEIEDLAYGGAGVSRHENYVVFVEGVVPGDRVLARIVKRKASHSVARVEEILRPSPVRIQPRCPLQSHCGGCVWQALPYDEQLKVKERIVEDSLARIGGLGEPPLEPIEPSPQVWRYRNKMDFTFGRDETGRPILGYHYPGRFDRIFSVKRCLLQPEAFDFVLEAVDEWAQTCGLPPYDPKTHDGILRTLLLRRSDADGRWLAALLSKTADVKNRIESLGELLAKTAPGFAGLIWGFNDGVADFVRMDREAGRVGEPSLVERIGPFQFRISPFSFFQTNTPGAETLYRLTREFAELSGRETLLDAYCGTGSIGIFCASRARQVVGVEIVREAVWDARANAALNGFGHCLFLAAPLDQGLALARQATANPIDRVIIDPPRGGMDKRSLRRLLELRAPVFVYVSCNPTTLARDVAAILESGYQVRRVKPVDMFPHTYHVETVIQFAR